MENFSSAKAGCFYNLGSKSKGFLKLFGVSQWPVEKNGADCFVKLMCSHKSKMIYRGVFRTQSNIYDAAFLRKYLRVKSHKAVNYFCKKLHRRGPLDSIYAADLRVNKGCQLNIKTKLQSCHIYKRF